MSILDFLKNMNSDQAQGFLSAGLNMMAASGPSRNPTNFGAAALAGLQGYQGTMDTARRRKMEDEEREALKSQRAQQMLMQKLQLEKLTRAQQKEDGISAAIKDSWQTPEQRASSLPGGPTPENAARIPEMQPGLDRRGLVARLMNVDPVTALEWEKSFAPAKKKLDKTTYEVVDGKTAKVKWYEDGSHEIVQGMQPRDEMKLLNLKNRQVAYNPFALKDGQQFQMGVDPDTVYSGNITMRGQNMKDARDRDANEINRQGQRTQIINDPIQGPLLIDKGTRQAFPAIGADGKPIRGEATIKKEANAKSLLPMLDEAEKLIGTATGSYFGAGVDQAQRYFGKSNPGSEAIAQLKVIEGNIMMNQPRMEGPQSNMDTELYRQMAGKIGDPTVPAAEKKAAFGVLRDIARRNAGVPAGPKADPGIDDLLKKYLP